MSVEAWNIGLKQHHQHSYNRSVPRVFTEGDQQQYRAPALHHCTQISILVSAGDDDGEDNDDDDDDEDDDGGAGTKSSASYHRLVLYNSQDDIQHRYLVDNDH